MPTETEFVNLHWDLETPGLEPSPIQFSMAMEQPNYIPNIAVPGPDGSELVPGRSLQQPGEALADRKSVV